MLLALVGVDEAQVSAKRNSPPVLLTSIMGHIGRAVLVELEPGRSFLLVELKNVAAETEPAQLPAHTMAMAFEPAACEHV